MEIADIKKLLAQSKKEPVNCAVGVSKDGLGQISLHKTKPPRTLLKELEGASGKLTTPAFGSAFVDIDEDPKLVILTLNKAPSGLAKRLKKSMAGTGFNKIEIRNEDGSVAEKDAGDEEAAAAPAAAPSAPQPTAPADLQKTLGDLIKRIAAATANDPASAEDLKRLAGAAVAAVRGTDEAAAAASVAALEAAVAKAEQAASGAGTASMPDFKTMQAELGQMIREVQAVAARRPDRLDALKTLAANAAAAIKANDAAAAPAAMTALREALQASTVPAAEKTAPLVIWREAKETVDARIGDLRKSVLAHPDDALKTTLAQIADKGLNGVTDRASVGMMAAMMEAEAQPAKALKAVETFKTFLASDIARGIDENPFNVAVGLRATLGDALERISQRLSA